MKLPKFRAWDKNTNTIYENISILPSMECIAINVDYDHDFQEYCIDESYVVELKDVELLEYTGIKDYEGKEIYEGDIVKKEFMEQWLEDTKFIGIVKMIEGSWCVVNEKKKKCKYLWSETDVNHVIGNIYENKNLLEEK
jgi:uncharacterized phage protein (TIGR01671 family)